ncbi:aminoglycoside phosphotransferase family protein [Streptomyces sp. NPDC005435]|uniref:aminoglycoside phosphotransferase family protein n=1 Tax=Streptomyces sp. NPDC005435 TaxID=3154464 RepID=UPI0034546B29
MIHRRDVDYITAEAETELLSAHGLDHSRLIATGTEAKVYGLGPRRVLKVYADPDGTQRARLETLRGFYDRLDRGAVPYALPRIHAVEPHGPLLAALETRLPGRPMGEACDLTASRSKDVYLDAVHALGALSAPAGSGHRMLLTAPGEPSAPDWHRFLDRLLTDKLPSVADTLAEDIPNFPTLVDDLRAALANPYAGPEAVIHGDLYPDNILMLDGTTVGAVIDFGTFTMTGDPLYDMAGACVSYRQYDPDRLTVWRELLDRAAERTSRPRAQLLRAYAEIIAILTCDLYAREGEPIRANGHYQWAVAVLRDLKWRPAGPAPGPTDRRISPEGP